MIECATAYDLPEEKKPLVELKEQAKYDVNRASVRGGTGNTEFSIGIRWTVEKQNKNKEFISRAFAAVFGGLAVVAPMLIMSLHPTKLTQLLTASLFVVSVALILARLMDDAEKKDVIAATAAYAAVLAVFVGASTITH
jgi:hypothetical protein